MSLRKVELKNAYDSDVDDILAEFYVPALSASIQYDRLTGFFSSTSLAAAAKGISGLIKNGGNIKLITGVIFQEQDLEAIRNALEAPEKVLQTVMLREFDNLEDDFVRDHVRALGWMIAKGRLKIKVAIVLDSSGVPLGYDEINKEGIFHQKVGILEDLEGNKISFSGSDNESARGWQTNIEEFKVFRNWVDAEKEYFETDFQKFQKFWEGRAQRTRIMDIPKAIEEKLIEVAPSSIEELNLEKWIQRTKRAHILGSEIIKKKRSNVGFRTRKEASLKWRLALEKQLLH